MGGLRNYRAALLALDDINLDKMRQRSERHILYGYWRDWRFSGYAPKFNVTGLHFTIFCSLFE
jgi:hypothetical protein